MAQLASYLTAGLASLLSEVGSFISDNILIIGGIIVLGIFWYLIRKFTSSTTGGGSK